MGLVVEVAMWTTMEVARALMKKEEARVVMAMGVKRTVMVKRVDVVGAMTAA